MKAFILAAGFGTRLRPLTHKTPKPLLPIFGSPLINHIIDHLKGYGIKDIVVNNHYLGNQIVEYLGDGRKFDVRINHSQEKTILGSGGAIGGAAEYLKEGNFFVLYNGDIMTDINLADVMNTHCKAGNDVTMALIDRKEYNQVSVDSEGKIWNIRRKIIEKKGQALKHLAYTGISVINTGLLSEFPDDREEDLIKILLKFIQKGIKVGYHFVKDCFWEDMGSLPSYFKLHKSLHESGHTSYVSSSAKIPSSVSLNGFYSIGEKAVVGEGCFLENIVVMDEAELKEGGSLSNCIFNESIEAWKSER